MTKGCEAHPPERAANCRHRGIEQRPAPVEPETTKRWHVLKFGCSGGALLTGDHKFMITSLYAVGIMRFCEVFALQRVGGPLVANEGSSCQPWEAEEHCVPKRSVATAICFVERRSTFATEPLISTSMLRVIGWELAKSR